MNNKLGYESISPLAAMKERVLKGGKAPGIDPIWRNYRPIPDILSFRIKVGVHDRLMLSFGLTKREDPVVEYTVYRNRDLNRYLKHQLIRMSKADDKTYWRIARFVIVHSKVFFIQALNHVFPRWYKDRPLRTIVRWYRRFRKHTQAIFNEVTEWDDCFGKVRSGVDLKYARVYIEKGNGRWRPLGVPSPVWRIISTMVAQVLTYRLADRIDPRQHAYLPGRSTLTAWREVLTKVIADNYIWEFDLKGFFDNVGVNWVIDWLMRKGGVSYDWLHLIRKFAATQVILPKELLVNEDNQLLKGSFPPLPVLLRAEERGRDWTVLEYDDPIGFPQGAAFAPLLSIIALERSLYDLNPGLVQYADDGIFHGNQPLNTSAKMAGKEWEFMMAGLEFSEQKCFWVRYGGKWLRPLRFLGFEYIPANYIELEGTLQPARGETWVIPEVFRSKTRAGKSLIFDKDQLILRLHQQDAGTVEFPEGNYSAPETRFSWEQLVNSRLAGLIQSRMYSGTWSVEEGLLRGVWDLTRGSWAQRVTKQSDPGIVTLANASSLASRSLLSLLKRVTSKPALRRPLERYVWERWYVINSRQRVSWLTDRVSFLEVEIRRLSQEVRETVSFLSVMDQVFGKPRHSVKDKEIIAEAKKQAEVWESSIKSPKPIRRRAGRNAYMANQWLEAYSMPPREFLSWLVWYWETALQHSRYSFEQNMLHYCNLYGSRAVVPENRTEMLAMLDDTERLGRILGHIRETRQRAEG